MPRGKKEDANLFWMAIEKKMDDTSQHCTRSSGSPTNKANKTAQTRPKEGGLLGSSFLSPGSNSKKRIRQARESLNSDEKSEKKKGARSDKVGTTAVTPRNGVCKSTQHHLESNKNQAIFQGGVLASTPEDITDSSPRKLIEKVGRRGKKRIRPVAVAKSKTIDDDAEESDSSSSSLPHRMHISGEGNQKSNMRDVSRNPSVSVARKRVYGNTQKTRKVLRIKTSLRSRQKKHNDGDASSDGEYVPLKYKHHRTGGRRQIIESGMRNARKDSQRGDNGSSRIVRLEKLDLPSNESLPKHNDYISQVCSLPLIG